MKEDLRSMLKRAVDDDLAAYPAPPGDLRSRAIRSAAARSRTRPQAAPRLVAAAAVALALVAVGVLLGLRVHPGSAPSPATSPAPVVTTTPSPSPTASATPAPTATPVPTPPGTPGTPPGSMGGAVAVYDPANQRVVMFGGSLGQCFSCGGPPETWVWAGTGWFELTPQTSPPVFTYATAVTMGDQGPVIVVGGLVFANSDVPPAAPTWQWDGRGWTQLHPQHSPPPGIAAGMAYDPARREAVLLTQGQTWTWDGSDWTQRQPATSPPAREIATMATSPSGSGVVLFGGSVPGNTSKTLGDTWTWDGTTWRLLSPPAAPAARDQASMVYDRAGGRVLLYGGVDDASHTTFADTWAWDGTTWSRLAQGGPAHGSRLTMAYDEATGQVVLFGDFGLELPDRYTATYTWSGTAWVRR